MVREITRYAANDGTEFDTYDEAVAHDNKSTRKAIEAYEKYINVTYSGRELLKKHTLGEYGVWQVFGEDPNCDMGGYHHQPELGFFEGTLADVIKKAVTLPRFWSWGGGGNIKKQNPPEVVKI